MTPQRRRNVPEALPKLGQFYAGVVIHDDVLGALSIVRHLARAPLGHANAVAKAASLEHNAVAVDLNGFKQRAFERGGADLQAEGGR